MYIYQLIYNIKKYVVRLGGLETSYKILCLFCQPVITIASDVAFEIYTCK